jgi:hypothetical protein
VSLSGPPWDTEVYPGCGVKPLGDRILPKVSAAGRPAAAGGGDGLRRYVREAELPARDPSSVEQSQDRAPAQTGCGSHFGGLAGPMVRYNRRAWCLSPGACTGLWTWMDALL